MQYTRKEIYKEVSDENVIPIEKVKVIGDIVFSEIHDKLKKPSSIILKIKGLGFFFLRRLKMQKFVDCEKNKKELANELLINILEERLKDYEKYIEKKQVIKKYRIKHGEIIEPVIEEE